MQDVPFFHIEKCPIPIVWPDTSIITNITKLKNNLPLQPIQKRRIVKFFNKIFQLIVNGKIICPMADQESEIWIHRDSWLKIMNSLSLGIRTKSELDIYNSQLIKSMTAYVKNTNDIYISYQDIFTNDPVKQLQIAISKKFHVCINRDITGGASYQYDKKKELYEKVEERRKINVKNNVSFSEQLEKEYSARIQTLIFQLKQSYIDSFILGKIDINSLSCVESLMSELHRWNQASGKIDDINGLVDFHYSNYYKEMPITKLSCNMYAYLMTKNSKIETGDSMDVKHISTVMPYSDLFITDRKMKNYLIKNKFDKLYNVKVCYIGDENEIYSFFESIKN